MMVFLDKEMLERVLMFCASAIIRNITDLSDIKFKIENRNTHLFVKITYYLREASSETKQLIEPEKQKVSHQTVESPYFPKKCSNNNYNTDPRLKYDTVVRKRSESGLEKDIKFCKNLTDIEIWTEEVVVTKEYFPKKESNCRLMIGALFPLNRVR